MSIVAKIGGILAALAVIVWAFWHTSFNGANLLVIFILAGVAVWFSHTQPRSGVWRQ